MSLCSSMAPLPYTGVLLTMTSKFFKSNIATKIKIRDAIKNLFFLCCSGSTTGLNWIFVSLSYDKDSKLGEQ